MTNEELFSKAVSGDWLAEKFERPNVADGVGKFLLKGTSKGFATFSDAIKDGQVVFFSAFDDACNREAGFAVYNASEKSLTPVESNSALANGKYLSGDVRPIPFPDGGTICGTFNAEAFNVVWEHVHNRQNPHEVTADQIPQDNYNALGDDVQSALDTLAKAISTLDPDALPDWQDVVRDDIGGNYELLQRPLNRFIHENGHGEWVVDEGGVPPGTVIGDVPMWKGREYTPVKLITDNILDVQSETASKGQLLVHNGTQWVSGDLNLDDLKDVNAGTPTRDDLIIWNGTNWVADDFSFIQTALRFKGGIAPTAAAPTNPEGGDLYVFDANGTVSGSWGVIAGREVQAGKFVGYAAGTHNRWYLLGDMADSGVMDVSAGIGIDVDDSTPSEPVVSIDRAEVDTWYEPWIGTKYSAFNKDFGTTAGTVAEGNHDHTGTYEPVINPKNTAFNKNFAGSGIATTVSRSDHTHSEYVETEIDPTVPQHVKNITTTQISNWDTAYGWGNHATQGYLKTGDVPNTDLSNYYTKGESDGKYEPKFTKNNAFNKNFGTAAGTVAKGDHTHSEYASKGDSYTKAESDAKYEQKGAGGGGGGGLPAGDWHCTGNITAVGNITAYYSSDERLKDDITAMPVGLIDGIEPVTWKWKEGGKKSGGVVAQQLQQCGLGNWVNEAPDGTLGVDYNALIGVLLAEVISLKKEVKDLKDAVA